MGVKDVALAAYHEQERERKEKLAAAEERNKEQRLLQYQEEKNLGRATLSFRKLTEWFPDAEWVYVERMVVFRNSGNNARDYGYVWQSDGLTFITGPDVKTSKENTIGDITYGWEVRIQFITRVHEQAIHHSDKYHGAYISNPAAVGEYLQRATEEESAYYLTDTD